MPQEKGKIINRQFLLLCLSSFLFFSGFNMLIPELPSFLTALGGEEYKGGIIAFFALAALLSRPFSGKLTDTVGRIPVMIIGVTASIICTVLYPVLMSVSGFFLLRFFHGMSTGFKPTATVAYAADIVPAKRRGEALGILGLSSSLGIAAGPILGGFLAKTFSWSVMFYTSSFVSLLSVAVLIGMKETLKDRSSIRLSSFKVSLKDVYEPRVLPPSVVMILTIFSFGIILTVIQDFSDYIGMANKGWFFTAFVTTSILIRILAGRFSDRYGRIIMLKIGTSILVLAMILIGLADSTFSLLLGAAVLGLAVGINSPTVFAWAVDLSIEEYRGRAMSTLYIALEIGIGSGALISAWIYSNNSTMFRYTFWAGALAAFGAFLYLFTQKNERKE